MIDPDAYTNAMWSDARTKWAQLSRAQQRALIGARAVQGGRVLCANVPRQTADALVARAICWSMVRGKICGGKLSWKKTERGWSGTCVKCLVQRRAASGEQRELEAGEQP